MKAIYSVLVLSFTMATSAFAAVHPHCFAIAAPLKCQNDQYTVILQRMDCFHTENTVSITRADGTSVISNLQVNDAALSENNTEHSPAQTYTGKDGFSLTVANSTSDTVDNTLEFNVPRGEKIRESNLSCGY